MERLSRLQKNKQQSQQSQPQELFFRSREKDFEKRRKARMQLLSSVKKIEPQPIKQQDRQNLKDNTTNLNHNPDNNQQDSEQINIFDQKLISSAQQQISQYPLTNDLGYYNVVVGTIINNKYKIIEKIGKGGFGVVLKAQRILEQPDKPKLVAIKILRKNTVTERSGIRQFGILKALTAKIRPKNAQSYIIEAEQSFYQNGHLCFVCQLLGEDLRTYLHKNQTKITLKLIRQYAICMFMSLHQLRKQRIIHADIKPDNFLINGDDPTKIKLGDFGTAYKIEEHVVTEDLVARYYRAPEIVLGSEFQPQYLHGIDTWAVGCSLYELYTGSFLFNANTNNQLLKQMMETCGKFNMKMLKKSINTGLHFDSNYNFIYQYIDKNNKSQKSQKMQVTITAERELLNLIKQNKREMEINMEKEEVKKLHQFKDLLEKCLMLNPKDRISPADVMTHPFISYQVKLQ